MKQSHFVFAGLIGLAATVHAAFTPGNLVVLDVANNGSTNASAITLKEFAYNGNGSFSNLPTNYALDSSVITLPGASDHDGLLRQSSDGSVLTFGGYGAPAGTANVAASTTVPRIIGTINSSFALSTTVTTGYAGTTIRSVDSTDGQHFWTAGNSTATGGQYYVDGNGSTQLTTVDARSNQIVKGQLWGTSSGGGGFTTGSGLPTTPGQTNTTRMTSAYVKSDAVYLDLDGNGTNDTAYTTDGKNLIGKWHSDDGVNWSFTGTYDGIKAPTAGTPFNDTNELAAYVFNGAVELLLVNQAGNLYQLTDTNGITANFSAAFLANTSPTPFFTVTDGSSFRGLVVLAPEPNSLAFVGLATMLIRRRRTMV